MQNMETTALFLQLQCLTESDGLGIKLSLKQPQLLNYVKFEVDAMSSSSSNPDLAYILDEFKSVLNSFLCWDSVFVPRHVYYLAHNIRWAIFFFKWGGPLAISSPLLGPSLGGSRWASTSSTPNPPPHVPLSPLCILIPKKCRIELGGLPLCFYL